MLRVELAVAARPGAPRPGPGRTRSRRSRRGRGSTSSGSPRSSGRPTTTSSRSCRQVAESVGPEGRYLHLGLTSSDVVDTGARAPAAAPPASSSCADADRLIARRSSTRARAEADTVMMGRTHSVHAEPTTFGLKLAGWAFEVDRGRTPPGRRRRRDRRPARSPGRSGRTATSAPEIEAEVLAELGLHVDPVSTQIVQRDRHAAFLAAIAILGGSLERFATEVRNLQHTEIGEVQEPFKAGQKGSSRDAPQAQPDPVRADRRPGPAAARLRPARRSRTSRCGTSATSATRRRSGSILPDATILLDYMLVQLTGARRGPRRPPGADAREHRARPRPARLVAGPVGARRARRPLARGGLRDRPARRPARGRRAASRCATCSRVDPAVAQRLSLGRPRRAASTTRAFLRHVPEVIARLDALERRPRPTPARGGARADG